MRKKPYTNAELFDIICKRLEEKNLIPDILDYYRENFLEVKEFNYYGFNVVGSLTFGSNEGMYLGMYAEGYISNKKDIETVSLGTFKTLGADHETCITMGNLMSEFIWESHEFIADNLDEFDRS